MSSALIMSDMGLRVRRFACVADARAAQANIESDGIGAALREVVCCWCAKPTGAAVLCAPGVLKPISDGMCAACLASQLDSLDADLLFNDVASPLAHGAGSLGVKWTAAPIVRREHASGGPAASSDFNEGRVA